MDGIWKIVLFDTGIEGILTSLCWLFLLNMNFHCLFHFKKNSIMKNIWSFLHSIVIDLTNQDISDNEFRYRP
jgi:hypothetical protein